MSINTKQKYENLKNIIKNYGSLAIAFSGGVDSTFLLKTAHDILGDNVFAVTVQSYFFTEQELNETKSFCEKENIRHIICKADVLSIEGVAQNFDNRCYLCKNEILKIIKQAVEPYSIKYIADGSNPDDDSDYRPGFQAVKEHRIKSPLKEAELSKAEIRGLSKELGLPTWNKPYISCLASRFVYGETITEKKLDMVYKAEQLLRDLGFTQFRVRIHGNGNTSSGETKGIIARIEIMPHEFSKITDIEISQRIYTEFKKYGFTYIALDLGGYRTGSMNETLSKETKNTEISE